MAALLGPLVGGYVGKVRQAHQQEQQKQLKEYDTDMRTYQLALDNAAKMNLWDDVGNITNLMNERTEELPGAKHAMKQGQLGDIGAIGGKLSQAMKQRQQQQKQQAQQQAALKAYGSLPGNQPPGVTPGPNPDGTQTTRLQVPGAAPTPAAPQTPGALPQMPPLRQRSQELFKRLGPELQQAQEAQAGREFETKRKQGDITAGDVERRKLADIEQRTTYFKDKLGYDEKTARDAAVRSVFEKALPATGSHNLTQVLYKKPGSEDLHSGWTDPRDPGKVFDAESGAQLEHGSFQLIDKTLAATEERGKFWGEFGNFYRAAKGQGMSDDAARNAAGAMVYKKYGVQLGRQEQQMAIDKALSGIGPGAGVPPSARPPASAALPGMPLAPVRGNGQPATGAAPPVATARPSASGAPLPQAGTGGPFGNLSPTERDDVLQYLGTLTGTQKGGGGKAGQVRTQAGLRAIAKATGLDPMTLTARLTETPALAKQIGETVQRSGAIQRLNNTIDTHGKILLQVAQHLKDTGSPLLNKPVREWARQAAGDPELKRVMVALNEMQREYAYLTAGGAQSRAMLPVHTSESMDKILSLDSTLPEMAAEVDQIGVGAKAELQAMNKTVKDLQGQMLGGPGGEASGAQPNDPLGILK
jgi:hypothetical protein